MSGVLVVNLARKFAPESAVSPARPRHEMRRQVPPPAHRKAPYRLLDFREAHEGILF